MTITQYEKATVILEKINELNNFIEVAEKHDGFIIRPFNTDNLFTYSIGKENKAIIMEPLRTLLNEWKTELERL